MSAEYITFYSSEVALKHSKSPASPIREIINVDEDGDHDDDDDDDDDELFLWYD